MFCFAIAAVVTLGRIMAVNINVVDSGTCQNFGANDAVNDDGVGYDVSPLLMMIV